MIGWKKTDLYLHMDPTEKGRPAFFHLHVPLFVILDLQACRYSFCHRLLSQIYRLSWNCWADDLYNYRLFPYVNAGCIFIKGGQQLASTRADNSKLLGKIRWQWRLSISWSLLWGICVIMQHVLSLKNSIKWKYCVFTGCSLENVK